MKYIIAIDIGGTTFNSGLFSESLNQISISKKDKIRHYDGKEEVVGAILNQVNDLLNNNNIKKNDIIGLGIASPGPLDSKKGIILETPNLKIFQNYKISNDFTKKLKIDTFIENDANLFALGEWHSQYRENNIVMGITLGTGLGFGLVINGRLFTGGHGMALEYSLSPFEWGMCEENVSIRYIRSRSVDLYGENISPRIIEDYYKNNDEKAIKIYHEYGHNLGIVLSHVINMIDPEVITMGGGLSKAFDCFKNPMFSALKVYAPSFNINKIIITPSKLREASTMLGASMMVKNIKSNI